MSFEKIKRIQNHEQFNEVDGILITKPQNVIYILGFNVESDVTIFIPNNGLMNHDGRIMVFLNTLEYDQAKKNIEMDSYLSKNLEIKLIPPYKPSYIAETITNIKLEKIGYEDDYISMRSYKDLIMKFKDIKLIEISEVIKDARKIKTQSEIERMKKAAELGEIGFRAVYNIIEDGMTEKELAAEAEYAMRKAGSDGTSFDTIVASGENSAFPHAKTSNKEIKNGDLIIVDIGAKFNGYCSDMTRTFIFGNGSQDQKDLVNLVNDGQKNTLNLIKAGLKCKDLDQLTRNYFNNKKKLWSNRFLHSLGHGVGIDIHESPYLSPISEELLEVNMVITIEPGLYILGLGGCRTEDQIVIKEDGYLSLTNSEIIYY